jgi:hypothetical protein
MKKLVKTEGYGKYDLSKIKNIDIDLSESFILGVEDNFCYESGENPDSIKERHTIDKSLSITPIKVDTEQSIFKNLKNSFHRNEGNLKDSHRSDYLANFYKQNTMYKRQTSVENVFPYLETPKSSNCIKKSSTPGKGIYIFIS